MTGYQQEQHPGDAYARAEIEAWYARNIESTRREVARWEETGRGFTYSKAEYAQDELADYEAGYRQWTEHGTMPWRHSETVSRVIGSIAGGPAAAFGLPVTLTPGEIAALEAGLDPGIETDDQAPPSGYEIAQREYRARWAVGYEAMGRMGLYRQGDPPTPYMHAEHAAELTDYDAWSVSVGNEPMWTQAIQEERAAAGPEALAAYAKDHPEIAQHEEQDPGRFDGIPGLMWYAKSEQVRGDQLKIGDWLDSLDHRGARMIYAVADGTNGIRTVWFSEGGDDCEIVQADVFYEVVDPDSQVAPDGSPMVSQSAQNSRQGDDGPAGHANGELSGDSKYRVAIAAMESFAAALERYCLACDTLEAELTGVGFDRDPEQKTQIDRLRDYLTSLFNTVLAARERLDSHRGGAEYHEHGDDADETGFR